MNPLKEHSAPSTRTLPFTIRIGFLLRSLAGSLRRLAAYLNGLGGHMVFIPRPEDIYIASYPGSGTTWLQMIVYQLASQGNTHFAHICEVVPFFERSLQVGRNLNVLPPPRLFKTHYSHRRLPKVGKYIYVYRNGKDVLLSYFHFYKSHLRYRGSFEEFFERFLEGRVGYGSWFNHVSEWKAYAARNPNCLIVRYEDLQENLAEWLPKIADFCGQSIETEKCTTILEHCSFDFMKRHEDKFDHTTGVLWELGLTQGNFIRLGQIDSWKQHFTREQSERFEAVLRLRGSDSECCVGHGEPLREDPIGSHHIPNRLW